ncbi:hypothetical protein [Rhodococcus sp. (in: high G+C Gram-positive bacteria)]|uniref:hypothetical protein n=1 Tax=Rhodococcus sp. TaxID=1831 RepID=UPI00257D28AF|nr:hypothetical protein [Rhodococcus sp. (in: high G+C Gram-positive bacteria)]MBQ7803045.1 hypothetical protein [Rhodococcus sp. (in: high G+C Gram-positive bacteria)]
MNYGPSPEAYPMLPGPARFVQDITADLGAGKSAVVIFPDHVVESGIADAILDDIAAEGARTTHCQESSDPFPTRIITTFGADPVSARAFDEWDTITAWDAWHGAWVLVPGWLHQDVAEIVDRWPAQVNACGLSAEDRPKLVIAVRLSDLPRKKANHVDRNSIAVHWWWGVLDRLDTQTRVAANSGRNLNPVEAAVITEVSGWDLVCTDFLTAHWDRTTAGLPNAVHHYRTHRTAPGEEHTAPRPPATRGVIAPPPELEPAWNAGLVDRWGHSVRQAPHSLDDAAVEQRLWMAHNRILISHVDEERSDYEQMIRSKASPRALDDLRLRDDDIIEIGSLLWLVNTGKVDIGREHRLQLQTFRDLRNDLAHRRPINDELLQRATHYLKF